VWIVLWGQHDDNQPIGVDIMNSSEMTIFRFVPWCFFLSKCNQFVASAARNLEVMAICREWLARLSAGCIGMVCFVEKYPTASKTIALYSANHGALEISRIRLALRQPDVFAGSSIDSNI
jgi:hypothetical protein